MNDLSMFGLAMKPAPTYWAAGSAAAESRLQQHTTGGETEKQGLVSGPIGYDGRMCESEFQHDARIDKALAGDSDALADLFAEYRPRLKRMVALRMDARVRARIDPSDVVQEAFVDVARRCSDELRRSNIPFFLWVRMVTRDRLTQIHRQHLGTEKRDANREVSMNRSCFPEASNMHLASQLAGQFTSVDRRLIGQEVSKLIEDTLNTMDVSDREVIAMRHFEELSTEEIAVVLDMTPSGVLKRYARAIRRLSKTLNTTSSISLQQ